WMPRSGTSSSRPARRNKRRKLTKALRDHTWRSLSIHSSVRNSLGLLPQCTPLLYPIGESGLDTEVVGEGGQYVVHQAAVFETDGDCALAVQPRLAMFQLRIEDRNRLGPEPAVLAELIPDGLAVLVFEVRRDQGLFVPYLQTPLARSRAHRLRSGGGI